MKKTFLLFALIASFNLHAQEAYLCIATQTAGFYFNNKNKQWESTKFQTSDVKYLLKKKSNGWEFMDFGSNAGLACGNFHQSRLKCDLILGELYFDNKTLRFLKTYVTGYIDGRNSNEDTPSVQIGSCSPL